VESTCRIVGASERPPAFGWAYRAVIKCSYPSQESPSPGFGGLGVERLALGPTDVLALFLGSEECWECWEDDDLVGFTWWGADIARLREGASDLSVLWRIDCWEFLRERFDELLGE
jgi:hypothetical protein